MRRKIYILTLKEGRLPFLTNYTSARPTPDPNTMDIDTLTLSKLSPTEHAKCIREARCFRCRLPGHNAVQCKRDRNTTNPCPQTIRSAETENPTPLATAKDTSPIKTFVNLLKTQAKTEAEILQVLQMCYEEPKEEISVVSTLDSDF